MVATPNGVAPTACSSQTFVALWGAGVAFHQYWLGFWIATPLDTALTGAALLLAFHPSSTRFLIAFLLTHITRIVVGFPYVWNHEVLALILDLHFLAAVVIAARLRRSWPVSVDEAFSLFAPAARTAYITLYVFTTLHKLNSDFLFHPDVSCAGEYYRVFVETVPWFRVGSALAPEVCAIAITLASEAVIPILLVPRRTRPLGVLWAAAFHALVGTTNNTDFSAIAFALISLFISPDYLTVAVGRASQWLGSSWRGPVYGVLARASMRIVLLVALIAIGALVLPKTRYDYQTLKLFWLAVSALFVLLQAGGVVHAWRRTDRAAPLAFALRGPAQWALQILLIAAGLSPYIGFRTEGSFAMFSNLRTEGGHTNHLFMPLVPVFGYQNDLVEIVSTNDKRLLRMTSKLTHKLVLFEFQKYIRWRVHSGRHVRVGILLQGRRMGPLPAEEIAWRLPEYNALETKLLWFRPVPADGQPHVCQH
jgi:hypothetical protein